MPSSVNSSALATERSGVVPIAGASSRAVSSAAFERTARITRSAFRTASSFVAPSTPSTAAISLARAASREPITTLSPSIVMRSASARPKVPVPPTIAILMAVSE